MSWTHLRDTRGRSRKPRICDLCGRRIEPQTVRVKRVGIMDGEFAHSHLHVECEAATHDWDEMDWETHIIGEGDWPEVSE